MNLPGTKRPNINRRAALTTGPLALFSFLASTATAQTQQPSATAPVFQHDLPNIALDGWEVTVDEIVNEPGSVGRPHRHPGFVLVYVLEGEIVTKISGQPQRTYTAGEMFYEPPGATHEVSNNASPTKRARFLAFVFHPKGAPLVQPVTASR